MSINKKNIIIGSKLASTAAATATLFLSLNTPVVLADVNKSYVKTQESQSAVKTEFGASCLQSLSSGISKVCNDEIKVSVEEPLKQEYKVQTIRQSFGNSSLFGFNQSSLSEQGKKAIDNLVRKTANYNQGNVQIESITVVGHTDELGTAQYNQKLSEKRAQTVANYISDRYQVPSSAMQVIGAGKQYAKMGEVCKQQLGLKVLKATPKVVQCLAPDRKVDVSVKFQYKQEVPVK